MTEDVTEVYLLMHNGSVDMIETDVEENFLKELWVENGQYDSIVRLPLALHSELQMKMTEVEKLKEEREHDGGLGEAI